MKKILLSFVLALFAMPALAFADFSDVKQAYRYYDSINWMEENGVVQGYEDGTFRPANVVTRVAFLKMMQLTLGIDFVVTDFEGFSDTPETEWYAPYLAWALSYEIVDGYPDGTFRPGNSVNVVEAMKIVVNGFFDVDKLYGEGNIYSPCYGFDSGDLRKKVDLSAWYWPYLYVADGLCLIPEEMVNDFDPSAPLTRGEMAELLYRAKAVADKAEENNGLVEDFDDEEEVGEIEEQVVVQDEVSDNSSGSGSAPDTFENPCDEEAKTLANGGRVLPVFEKYSHLTFLGQIFTAYDCGGSRVSEIQGVDEDGDYTFGVTFSIDFNPTPDLANQFWDKGFRCADDVGISQCKNWELREEIPVAELLFLRAYYAEIERDDCIFCG